MKLHGFYKRNVGNMKLEIYSDSASRGNPGISAIAFMILTEDGRLLKRYSKCWNPNK